MKKIIPFFICILFSAHQLHGMFNLFGRNEEKEAAAAANQLTIQTLEALLTENQDTIKLKNADLQKAAEKLRNTEKDLQKANVEVKGLLTEKYDLEIQISDLAAQLEAGKQLNQKNTNHIKELTEEKAVAETQLATANMELLAKHAEIQKLMDEKNKLEVALEQTNQELKTVKEEKEQLSKENNELQQKITDDEIKHKEQEHQIKTISADRDQLKLLIDTFIGYNITNFELPKENPNIWDYLFGNWHDLKHEVREEYFNTDYHAANGCSVWRVLCYVPDKMNGNNWKMVVPVIHGTFATSKEYCEDNQAVFKSLKNYVEHQANEKKGPVVLLSFNWTGENSEMARILGGDSFAKIFNRFFSLGWHDHHIAHSHGGAVLIWASHNFFHPAEQVTLLATPPRESEDARFMPRNIKKLDQFWSDNDGIQAVGSLKDETWGTLIKSPLHEGSCRKFEVNNQNVAVRNIRVLIDGEGPGHTVIKNVLWLLHDIEKQANKDFKGFADLQANIVINKFDYVRKKYILAIRRSDSLLKDMQISQQAEQLSVKNKQVYSDAYGLEMDATPKRLWKAFVGANTWYNAPEEEWQDNYGNDPLDEGFDLINSEIQLKESKISENMEIQ